MPGEYGSNLAREINDFVDIISASAAVDGLSGKKENDCKQSKSGQVITHFVQIERRRGAR